MYTYIHIYINIYVFCKESEIFLINRCVFNTIFESNALFMALKLIHNFMKHAKFTLIEQLTEISNVSKDTLRLQLKRREDFWIIKVETLAPKGLNQELNNV